MLRMKRWQFVILIIFSVLCLAVSVATVVSSKLNQDLQTQLQRQQVEISRGNQSQQIGNNLVRDIASGATKNAKLRDLLARNGFNMPENPSPAPGPASSPSPPPRR